MIHERNDLTNIQKFHYLKLSVNGEAITHDNYITAYNLLKSRFENKRIIVQQHVNTIINLPQITKGSPASLRQLLDGLSTNLSILKNLDIPVQSWDIILIQLILSKLDYQSRREWETSCKTTNIPTLKESNEILTAQYRAIRISSFTRGFKWSQISNQLTNSQVTAQWEDRCYLRFYLFISSVTIKRILTCGISVDSEK
jgi:hypothetical protein